MHLLLDDFNIENRHLRGILQDPFTKQIMFDGLALDLDGKEICDHLSKFRKGDIIEVGAQSYDCNFEGICEIVNIEIKPPEMKKRMIFRFSEVLKPVE